MLKSKVRVRRILSGRLGAGLRTKHIDAPFFGDGDLSIKEGITVKICADIGTKPVAASVLQQHCKFA